MSTRTNVSSENDTSTSTGTGLLAELKAKYNPAPTDAFDPDVVVLFGKKQVEMIGMQQVEEKKKQLDKLEDVSLTDRHISYIESSFGQHCPGLRALDLTGNEISEWAQIDSLLAQVPLESLVLSRNPLQSFDSSFKWTSPSSLKTLVLNGCPALTWRDICNAVTGLPNLRELHISNMQLANLSPEHFPRLEHLEAISIERNQLSHWSELSTFAALPALKRLVLNENPFGEIKIKKGEFQALEQLFLAGTALASFESIHQLAQLPALNSLTISTTPLVQQYGKVCWLLVVAKLPSLTSLNRSHISKNYRDEAEKVYLKWIANEIAQSGNKNVSDQDLETKFPRYKELVQKYGKSSPDQKQAETLAEEMVQVTISSPIGTQKKNLPSSFTIGNLKLLVQRLFRIEQDKQLLFYKSNPDSPFPEQLDDDSKTLFYFGITEKGEIFVQEQK